MRNEPDFYGSSSPLLEDNVELMFGELILCYTKSHLVSSLNLKASDLQNQQKMQRLSNLCSLLIELSTDIFVQVISNL